MEVHQSFYEDHVPIPEKYGLSKERIEELIVAKIKYDKEKFKPKKFIGILLTVISWVMIILSLPMIAIWVLGTPSLVVRSINMDSEAFLLFIIPIIYYGIVFLIFWITQKFFKPGFIYQFEWNAYQRYLSDLKRYNERESKR